MVLIRNMVITLIELTVPYDSRENLRNARARKSQKSSHLELLGDLEAKGYSTSPVTCAIPSLGYSPPICLKAIHELFPSVPRSSVRAMFHGPQISFGHLRTLYPLYVPFCSVLTFQCFISCLLFYPYHALSLFYVDSWNLES